MKETLVKIGSPGCNCKDCQLERAKTQIEKMQEEIDRLFGQQYGMADWVQRARDLEKDNALMKAEIELMRNHLWPGEKA